MAALDDARLHEEIEMVKTSYDLAKTLARSEVPIIRDNSLLVLAILRDLLCNIAPWEFCEKIVEYE